MRKLIRFLLFASITIQVLTACSNKGRFLELTLCGAYAVPGTFHSDLKGNVSSVMILEEDVYGRILFEYVTTSVIKEEKITALVICQKIDSKYVYFYEDQCYLFSVNEEPEIDLLKANNDWGIPLNESKMSRRANKVSFDLFIVNDSSLNGQRIRDEFASAAGVSKSQVLRYGFLDIDNAKSHELYWIYIHSEDGDEYYFAISNESYQISYLNVTDGFDPTEVAALKQDSGWRYG